MNTPVGELNSPLGEGEHSSPTTGATWLRRSSKAAWVVCWLYTALIVGAWVLMRTAGERWWPATFLLFLPRWIWAAPLAAVLPAALFLRRRSLWLVLATGAFVVFASMDLRVPWGELASKYKPCLLSVRVLTCNLHRQQADLNLLDAFVLETQPDIVTLQDVSRSRLPRSLTTSDWHTHQYGQLWIASRFPLRLVQPLRPDSFRVGPEEVDPEIRIGAAAGYAIDMESGTVHLVNLHLSSPHLPLEEFGRDWGRGSKLLEANSERRRRESQMIRDAIRGLDGPLLLAGDFNTPRDSPIFRQAWADYRDAFTDAGFGFGTTYAKHNTWLRIDHILYDPGWRCRECRVGPDIGSGHRPVFAVLER